MTSRRLFGRSLIEAATTLDYSLPEVFAGYARSETAFPVAYPTAAKPQAWAAGAPVLCITLLLGLSPEPLTGASYDIHARRRPRLAGGNRARRRAGARPHVEGRG